VTADPPTGAQRQRIQFYFLDTRPRYAWILLAAGLVLAELALGKLLLVCGLVWLGVGLVLATQRPSDEEVDRFLASDLGAVVERATRAFDRAEDEVRAPALALLSPLALAGGSSRLGSYRMRTGRDGRRRSPVNRAVVLLPMADQLGIYSCAQSSLTGEVSSISIEEHHYRDIVSLRMEVDMLPIASTAASTTPRAGLELKGPGRQSIQRLTVELTNGGKVAVVVTSAWQPAGAGDSALQPTDLEKALTAIRALLRDKR
jgi:hypothetical protein